MNVLLLGGSGFLSGHVARAALAAGHRITVVTRGRRAAPPGVTALVADRKDRPAFAQALSALPATYDLAVDCIGFDADDARQDLDLLCPRAKTFVFVSTDFVYAPPPGQDSREPIDETYPHFETALPYGLGKRAAELLLLSTPTPGCTTTVLRPGHIYGPGSLLGCLPLHGRDPDLLRRLGAREPITLLDGGRLLQQPVYAPDLARMILSCAGKPHLDHQIYHAAGPDVVESAEYYRLIARHLGVAVTILDTPLAPFLQANPDKRPFCRHRVYAMAKAKSAGLDVPATPLARGLADHADALRV